VLALYWRARAPPMVRVYCSSAATPLTERRREGVRTEGAPAGKPTPGRPVAGWRRKGDAVASQYEIWECIWCASPVDFERCAAQEGTLYCDECGGEVGTEVRLPRAAHRLREFSSLARAA
jgi:hypothetical protein